MAPDLVVQFDRRQIRFDTQFTLERADARPVLDQRQVWLTLPAVAAHQPPVCVLPARILFDDVLTQVCGRRVSPGTEVEVAEPPEYVEVCEAQAFPDQRRDDSGQNTSISTSRAGHGWRWVSR
jgi:hypothetical protein